MHRTVFEIETQMPVSELFEWLAMAAIDADESKRLGGDGRDAW